MGPYVPLLVALPVCLVAFGAEVIVGHAPELLAQSVALNPLPWTEAQTWEYEIRNAADDYIGDAVCTLTPEPDAVTVVCQQDQQGYKVWVGRSFRSSIPFVGERFVRWDRETYTPLLDLSNHEQRLLEWTLGETTITVEVHTRARKRRYGWSGCPGSPARRWSPPPACGPGS